MPSYYGQGGAGDPSGYMRNLEYSYDGGADGYRKRITGGGGYRPAPVPEVNLADYAQSPSMHWAGFQGAHSDLTGYKEGVNQLNIHRQMAPMAYQAALAERQAALGHNQTMEQLAMRLAAERESLRATGYMSHLRMAGGFGTEGQKREGLGYLNEAMGHTRAGMQHGGITDDEYNQGITDVRQRTASTARAMQSNINSALAARGIVNPLAGMVTNMAGGFAAGGESGRARNEMNQARQQGRISYTGMHGNLAGQAGSMAAGPTQESAMGAWRGYRY